MDEATWLACTDPVPLIEYLWGKSSDRKARLLMCACCRRVWSELDDENVRNAVKVAERFAVGEANANELQRATTKPLLAVKYWGGRRGEIALASADTFLPENPFCRPRDGNHSP